MSPEPIDPGGTEPMFAIPQAYRPPKRRTEPTGPKWAKFKGHFTCDLCIMNVHDGISDTPLTQAKWSLTTVTRRWLLCSVHATQVRNGERRLGS